MLKKCKRSRYETSFDITIIVRCNYTLSIIIMFSAPLPNLDYTSALVLQKCFGASKKLSHKLKVQKLRNLVIHLFRDELKNNIR